MRRARDILVLASLLCLALIFPASGEAVPIGSGSIAVTVVMDDPSSPGIMVPAAGLWVALHPALDWDKVIYTQTDTNGQITFSDLDDGLTCVYLPKKEDLVIEGLIASYDTPYFWDNLIYDEDPRFLTINAKERVRQVKYSLHAKRNDGTTSVRIQKSFYPYHYYNEGNMFSIPAQRDLMVFSGPQVTGVEFILARQSFLDQTIDYFQNDGTFSAVQDTALVFVTDENGQFLIENLPIPTDFQTNYYLIETKPAPGAVLPEYNNVPLGWLQEGIINTQYTGALINTPGYFAAAIQKVDEEGKLLLGGEFIVYKRNAAGQEEYLAYRRPLEFSSPAISYYTSDQSKAYVFQSSNMRFIFENESTPSSFLIPGLSTGTTYYLRELTPPAGYLIAPDLQIDESMAWVSWDSKTAIPLINQRDMGAVKVQKVVRRYYNPVVWEDRPLSSVDFVLRKTEADGYRFLVSGGNDGKTPVFGEIIPAATYMDTLAGAPQDTWTTVLCDWALQKVFTTSAKYGEFGISGLPAGQYTLMEIKTPAGYLLDWDNHQTDFEIIENQAAPELFIVNSQLPDVMVFEKIGEPEGVLLPGVGFQIGYRSWGTDSIYPKDHFLTSLPDSAGGGYVFSDDPALTPIVIYTDEDGRIALKDLPDYPVQGRSGNYFIREVKPAEGYAIKPGMADTFFTPTWEPTTTITNYQLGEVALQLRSIKTLDGVRTKTPFTFELLHEGKVIATANNDESGLIQFDEIWLTPYEGMKLTLREQIPAISEGIRYDLSEYTSQVKFDTAGTLTLPAITTRQSSGPDIVGAVAVAWMFLGELDPEFHNETDLTSHVGIKAWSGGSAPRPQVTFQLLRDGEPYLAPVTLDGKTDTLGESSPWEFTWKDLPAASYTLKVDQEGKRSLERTAYTYSVKEINPPEGYTASVVKDENSTTITNTKPDLPPPVTYPTIKVPLTAKKVLQNGRLTDGQFTFELRDATGKVISEVTNQRDGTIVFKERTFSREVTNYLYTIREKPGSERGYTYDTSVYTVRITTRAVGNALTATVDIQKDGVPTAAGIVFTNKAPLPKTGDSAMQMILSLLLLALPLGGLAMRISRKKR